MPLNPHEICGLALRLTHHLAQFMFRRPLAGPGPFRLWVDITSRCNLRCISCPQRDLPPDQRRDMDPEVLAWLVNQVRGVVGEVNLFHRGEALLRPDLPLWVRRFREAGSVVRIHTNATLLDAERVAGLLWARPQFLTLSVDSLDPDEYARMRPGASLDRTLAGVERLLEARRRLDLDRPKLTLLTMGEEPPGPGERATLERLLIMGLDRWVHRRPHNWAGAVGPGMASGKRPAVCTFPWYGLAVLSDGRVTPCPQDFFGQITLGRAGEGSLAGIWWGRAARALRQAHAWHVLNAYPVCQACDRIHRPTTLGLPTEHLKNLLSESIVRAR